MAKRKNLPRPYKKKMVAPQVNPMQMMQAACAMMMGMGMRGQMPYNNQLRGRGCARGGHSNSRGRGR